MRAFVYLDAANGVLRCRYGPVFLYPQFPVIADADQISFHTQDALLVLTTAAIISHGTCVY